MAPRCCGFAAVRCFLILLNSIYIAIALFLIGLVVAAHILAYNFTHASVIIGVAVVAVVLFLVAILGLVGTLCHNQIVMFFYMILLGFSGMALFAVSVGCLSVPQSLQDDFFRNTWKSFSDSQKSNIQDNLNCCGFDDRSKNSFNCSEGHPPCNTPTLLKACCKDGLHNTSHIQFGDWCTRYTQSCQKCNPCFNEWRDSVNSGLKVAGALGLIFSFTQIAGIILTFRHRNLKDPNINPGDYL